MSADSVVLGMLDSPATIELVFIAAEIVVDEASAKAELLSMSEDRTVEVAAATTKLVFGRTGELVNEATPESVFGTAVVELAAASAELEFMNGGWLGDDPAVENTTEVENSL